CWPRICVRPSRRSAKSPVPSARTICSGASSPASVSANNPPEPCGKQRLNPVNKPGEKALHIQPVHNIGFHPQQFSSFPPAKAQERHSLVQCAKPCISWDTWIYPQNF